MSRRRIVTTIIAMAVGTCISFPKHALGEDSERRPNSNGSPRIEREARDAESIPLRHIDVNARVSGSLAEVSVEQVYENRLQQRVEAIYIFPLPDDAAVNEMVMVIGDRRIVADLRERQDARRAFEQARERGQAASLLEQERPNVFTMSVANIQPGQQIRVLVRYVEQLPYRDDRYHFHFPTVVGPRFIPGAPQRTSGSGVVPDTNRVPDASRITPSVLPEGVRTPYDVDFNLDLAAPMPIQNPNSSSHNLVIQRVSDEQVRAELAEAERQPNRDIELSYSLASNAPAFGVLTTSDPERGGFFTLLLEPPVRHGESDVRPRELVFVLDTSGSMSGEPLDTAKEAVRHAIRNLNPDDTFQIIRFSDSASTFSPIPLANTPANVRLGLLFIDSLAGGGGTDMTSGILAALRPRRDPQRLRVVLFLTDGYIGNEQDVLQLIELNLGGTRLFSLGIGSSVNRYLLDRMGQVGRGTVHYVSTGATPDEVVQQFYERFRNPILTDITIDWGGLDVSQVVPQRIPDVFAGTPIAVAGRFAGGGSATIHVRGKHGRRRIQIPVQVELPQNSAAIPAIAHIWARRRIDELELTLARDQAQLRTAVLPIALQFNLMSQFTSFVAVEQRLSPDTSDPLRTIGIPVALPQGTTDRNMGPQVQQPFNGSAAMGNDPENALGALMGHGAGNFGYGGLGLRGTGRGGGGTGNGNIGLGNLDTVGRGAPGRAGSGYARGGGGGGGNLRGRRASVPVVRAGTATVRGSLSRDVIRRYIRRHLNQIRYCYEQQLAREPDLAGRVAVRFIIGPDGRVTVAAVANSTLASPAAEQCIAHAVQRISFPAIDGGGVVVVTYPFSFRPVAQPPRRR